MFVKISAVLLSITLFLYRDCSRIPENRGPPPKRVLLLRPVKRQSKIAGRREVGDLVPLTVNATSPIMIPAWKRKGSERIKLRRIAALNRSRGSRILKHSCPRIRRNRSRRP